MFPEFLHGTVGVLSTGASHSLIMRTGSLWGTPYIDRLYPLPTDAYAKSRLGIQNDASLPGHDPDSMRLL